MAKDEPERTAKDVTGVIGTLAGSDTSVKVTDTKTGNSATETVNGSGHDAKVAATEKATETVDALQPESSKSDDDSDDDSDDK